MSTVKANAVITDPAVRALWLADAQAAAAQFSLKPGRVAVVEADDTGNLRLRAELSTDQEGRRVYRLVEREMEDRNVEPGSWMRLTNGDGTLGLYREWPPMPTG